MYKSSSKYKILGAATFYKLNGWSLRTLKRIRGHSCKLFKSAICFQKNNWPGRAWFQWSTEILTLPSNIVEAGPINQLIKHIRQLEKWHYVQHDVWETMNSSTARMWAVFPKWVHNQMLQNYKWIYIYPVHYKYLLHPCNNYCKHHRMATKGAFAEVTNTKESSCISWLIHRNIIQHSRWPALGAMK